MMNEKDRLTNSQSPVGVARIMLGTLLSTTLRMFGPTAAGGVIGWLIGRANDHGKVGLLIGTVVGAVLAAILVWLQLRKLDTKGRA